MEVYDMCNNCMHANVCKYNYETPDGEIRSMFKECDSFKPERLDIPYFLKEANRLGYTVKKAKKQKK